MDRIGLLRRLLRLAGTLASLSLWGLNTSGIGIAGGQYDWPWHLLHTDPWFAGDTFLAVILVAMWLL